MKDERLNRPVILGGVVMDLRGRPRNKLQLFTSNPGFLTQVPGGVGRNIAENLVRLGIQPRLISAVGLDLTGDSLCLHSDGIGLDCSGIYRLAGERSAIYLAILNEDGDLHTAIADMAIFQHLTPERVLAQLASFETLPLVIMDTNLPVETLASVAQWCRTQSIPLLVEPVSVEKSRKLHGILHHINLLTPNQDELAALASQEISTEADLIQACKCLVHTGLQNLVVTLGKDGALLANRDGIQHVPAFPAQVVDVTGAGDAFVAGLAYGILRGTSLQNALQVAMALGKFTVETHETVWSQLKPDILEQFLQEV